MQPLDSSDKKIAVISELLYLANLLILPGIAFLVLTRLFVKYRKNSSDFARSHLTQTFYASLVGGFLIVIIVTGVLLFGGFEGVYIWMWVILYFTLVHSTLVVFGALGLAKAMSSQSWQYPLFGRYFPKD